MSFNFPPLSSRTGYFTFNLLDRSAKFSFQDGQFTLNTAVYYLIADFYNNPADKTGINLRIYDDRFPCHLGETFTDIEHIFIIEGDCRSALRGFRSFYT